MSSISKSSILTTLKELSSGRNIAKKLPFYENFMIAFVTLVVYSKPNTRFYLISRFLPSS